MRARVPNGAQAIPTILSALDGRGFQVASVTTARPSLDDVYLHYTGPRLRDRGRGRRLMQLLRQTGWMIVRQLRNLMREPIWVALMVIQPLIWLLLYGQLFSRVGALRGGASTLHRVPDAGDRLHERLLRRQLVGDGDDQRPQPSRDRPLPRRAGVAASRSSSRRSCGPGSSPSIQALILLLLGLALGVRVHGGVAGWFVVFAAAALLAMAFAGFSHGIALLVRKEASMIAAANFVGLPLMFISAILIPPRQMPHWIAGALALQPGELGRPRRPERDRRRRRLGRERDVPRSPRRGDGLHVIVRDVVLPRLSALYLAAQAPESARADSGTRENP